jgi:hypothetical protein
LPNYVERSFTRNQRLRRLRILWISTAAVAFAGAIAYGEFVLDWRVQGSDQRARFTMAVTHSLSLINYNKLLAEMKQKYGDRATTSMEIDTGFIQVTLDGEVIETRAEKKELRGVYGIVVIGPKDAVTMRFPFSIAPKEDLASVTRSVADWFRNRFKEAPRDWLEFTDNDWTIDRCASLPDGLGLGAVGKALRMREGASCVVTWKGPQPGSMLVSVGRADGDPWMRPFVRRLCRAITQAALERFNPARPDSPKYAACIMADRPEYVSAQKSLTIGIYSVGPGNDLARME